LQFFCVCSSAGARPEYHVFFGGEGGLSPGHGEREPVIGVFLKPPEAENLLASGCATEASNLPHSVRTLTLSKLVPALFRSANVLEIAAPTRE